MNQKQTQELCLQLLHADTENEVIEILKRAGFWDNSHAWRLYGDKEGNFAQAGNQQALPEAALVEKIVNCCDARLMAECLKRGIDPESAEAPKNVRDAVAMFFENCRAENEEAGNESEAVSVFCKFLDESRHGLTLDIYWISNDRP